MTRLLSLALCSIFIASVPASAHHSLSAYNRGTSKTVDGVVKEYMFMNPHARLIVVVQAEDGTMKEWNFEGGSVRRMIDRGFSANTLANGDKITVSYNPMRNGSIGGFFVGVKTADGRSYGVQR